MTSEERLALESRVLDGDQDSVAVYVDLLLEAGELEKSTEATLPSLVEAAKKHAERLRTEATVAAVTRNYEAYVAERIRRVR